MRVRLRVRVTIAGVRVNPTLALTVTLDPNPDPTPNPHQVSYKQLLRLFEPYAPSEVRQLGPGNLKQVCCLTLVVA